MCLLSQVFQNEGEAGGAQDSESFPGGASVSALWQKFQVPQQPSQTREAGPPSEAQAELQLGLGQVGGEPPEEEEEWRLFKSEFKTYGLDGETQEAQTFQRSS